MTALENYGLPILRTVVEYYIGVGMEFLRNSIFVDFDVCQKNVIFTLINLQMRSKLSEHTHGYTQSRLHGKLHKHSE